jgi:hypothetical protein
MMSNAGLDSEVLTEAEVRFLRDAVFGKPSTDNNWAGCRAHWLQPAESEWLMDMQYQDERRATQTSRK